MEQHKWEACSKSLLNSTRQLESRSQYHLVIQEQPVLSCHKVFPQYFPDQSCAIGHSQWFWLGTLCWVDRATSLLSRLPASHICIPLSSRGLHRWVLILGCAAWHCSRWDHGGWFVSYKECGVLLQVSLWFSAVRALVLLPLLSLVDGWGWASLQMLIWGLCVQVALCAQWTTHSSSRQPVLVIRSPSANPIFFSRFTETL